MERTSPPRILLIDLDNCPQQLCSIKSSLESYSHIIICYGSVEPKISLSLVGDLVAAIHQGKVEMIGMKKGGKNAADFGLAFMAGKLCAECKAGTEFTVISKDTGLDHVIDMLTRFGFSASRNPSHMPVKADPAKVEDSIKGVALAYAEKSLFCGLNPPRTLKTFNNAIKQYVKTKKLKTDPSEIATFLLESAIAAAGTNGKMKYCKEQFESVAVNEPAASEDEDLPF